MTSRTGDSQALAIRLRHSSIRGALLALAVVPTVSLLCLWVLATGRVYSQWRAEDSAATTVKNASAVSPSLTELARERKLTALWLASPRSSKGELRSQWKKTDAVLKDLRAEAGSARSHAPSSIRETMQDAVNYLDQLDDRRRAISERKIRDVDAFDFYTDLIADNIAIQEAFTRINDGTLSYQAQSLLYLNWVTEMLAREDTVLSTGWESSGTMAAHDYAPFVRWAGTKRSYFDEQVAPHLTSTEQGDYQKLADSSEWATLNLTEDEVMAPYADVSSGGAALPDSQTQWRSAYTRVSGELQQLYQRHSHTVRTGTDNLVGELWRDLVLTSLLGAATVLFAVPISWRLTRSVTRRVAGLRSAAFDLSDRLPDVVDRLRRGEDVDTGTDARALDYGSDELGQLADAINAASRTAVETAAEQARQRRGFEKLLQRIARRTQALIGLQLQKLDEMERRHENSEVLQGLFELDHLTARLRRYEENLVILGGGQTQRRWRHAAPLLDVLRSAQSEVRDYSRVQIEVAGTPWVSARAVGPLVHLLAELMENAAAFSKPPAPVEVRAAPVSRGLAVEVEDRGLGMEPEQYRAVNALMVDPPELEMFSRGDDVRLGLFVVARLAAGLDAKVEFRASVFGGSRVVLFLPAELLADPEVGSEHGQPPHALTRAQVTELPARRPRALPTAPDAATSPNGPAPIAGDAAQPETSAASSAPPFIPHARGAQPGNTAPARAPGQPPGSGPGQPAPGTTEGPKPLTPLPRRVRQASLAEQLRTIPPPDSPAAEPASQPAPSRRAGATIAAFQRQSRLRRESRREPSASPSNPKDRQS